jgi:hypothetical protein
MKVGSLDGSISRLLFTNISINNINISSNNTNIEQDSSTLTITFNPFDFSIDNNTDFKVVFKFKFNGNYEISSINSEILTEDLQIVIGNTSLFATVQINIESTFNVKLDNPTVYVPRAIINYTGTIDVDTTFTRVSITDIDNWPHIISGINTIT